VYQLNRTREWIHDRSKRSENLNKLESPELGMLLHTNADVSMH